MTRLFLHSFAPVSDDPPTNSGTQSNKAPIQSERSCFFSQSVGIPSQWSELWGVLCLVGDINRMDHLISVIHKQACLMLPLSSVYWYARSLRHFGRPFIFQKDFGAWSSTLLPWCSVRSHIVKECHYSMSAEMHLIFWLKPLWHAQVALRGEWHCNKKNEIRGHARAFPLDLLLCNQICFRHKKRHSKYMAVERQCSSLVH